jgi:hypothetical protein
METTPAALWDVRWIHNRHVLVKNFHDDLASALYAYTQLIEHGRQGVTLHCKNKGFPPPQRLRAYTQTRGELITVEPLVHYNLRGWWWCPYCMQLRKFVYKPGFTTSGVYVPEPGYHCPVCGISHRDGAVRKYNPIARRLYVDGVRKQRA